MADLIRLTENWVTVTASAMQPLWTALDVLEYDVLDFIVYTGLDTPGSPNFTLTLLTGNQLQSPLHWIETTATVPITTNRMTGFGTTMKALPTLNGGFQRYLRWYVSLTNITTARFYIEGVGRKNA